MSKTNPDKLIKNVGIGILVLAFLISLFHFYPKDWKFNSVINAFYANISTELISIAITILLINYLYEVKEKLALKTRLIRELGSEDKGFTARALKEIKEFGWLTDGSLESCDLSLANLSGLDLSNAKLKGAIISKANLKGAILMNADLTNVDFSETDLANSILTGSTLSKTKFIEADLYAANFNNTRIQTCDFLKANLELTKLRDTEICDTLLEEANLSFADLEDSKIKKCKLLRADFSGINLKNSSFERNDIKGIINWDKANHLDCAKFNGTENPPNGFLELTNH